jgi:hypothetical protein
MNVRKIMPIYKVDCSPKEEIWWIENTTGYTTFNLNTVYPSTLELAGNIEIPGETVWVDQPNALAAFSQALMLFNGETK